MEPPMSVPCPTAPTPAATAAAAPPEEPPGVMAGIPRVARVAVQAVAAEPAQREGGRVGAPQQHGAGAAQVRDHRVVLPRDQVALDAQPVRGGEALLVHVDLDGDGHAGHRPGIVAARDRRIHPRRLGQHLLRPVVHDGVDGGVRGVEPRQRVARDLGGGDVARPHAGGDLGRGQAPELGHASSPPARMLGRAGGGVNPGGSAAPASPGTPPCPPRGRA
jgi:hypothetical protein